MLVEEEVHDALAGHGGQDETRSDFGFEIGQFRFHDEIVLDPVFHLWIRKKRKEEKREETFE